VYWGHEFDLSGSSDVIDCDHLISHRPFPIGGPLEGTKLLSLTVSEIFNGECDAVVDMTLNDL